MRESLRIIVPVSPSNTTSVNPKFLDLNYIVCPWYVWKWTCKKIH